MAQATAAVVEHAGKDTYSSKDIADTFTGPEIESVIKDIDTRFGNEDRAHRQEEVFTLLSTVPKYRNQGRLQSYQKILLRRLPDVIKGGKEPTFYGSANQMRTLRLAWIGGLEVWEERRKE